MKHIVVVDDEKRIRDLIVMYLKKEGYLVTDFDNADAAYEFLQGNPSDLIVLDIMMRGTNGLDLCKNIRRDSDIPIIFVSARSEELDRILGLELGADDYLPKPFSMRELMVRIKNILKRTAGDQAPRKEAVLSVGDITIFTHHRSVRIREEEVSVTAKEYEVLRYLVENKGYPLSRETIIRSIWGYEYDGYDRNVDDTIKRLRKKLNDSDSNVQIQTVWGFGYKVPDHE